MSVKKWGRGRTERRDDDDPKWAICAHCGKFFPFDRTCNCKIKVVRADELERMGDEILDPPA